MRTQWHYKEASREDAVPVGEDGAVKLRGYWPSTAEPGHQLRRFWLRAVAGVVAPPLIAGYFLGMWRILLEPVDPSAPFIVAPPGAIYVYYSWFIVGVLGLNLSLYVMSGAEAGMLMEPAWDVGDAMMLLMHADSTWGGPGGWMKTFKRVLRLRKAGGSSKLPSRLWFCLALPSLLVFTAWPLSGLSFETTAGFVRPTSGRGRGASVTGFSYASFNDGTVGINFGASDTAWQFALDARVPGKGIIYTQPGAPRVPHTVLPKEDGVSKIFLTAQAENPIEGNSWGMALQYNCSIVNTLSDLTLLRYQKPSNLSVGNPRMKGRDEDVQTATASDVYNNLRVALEFGYRQWPNASAKARVSRELSQSIFNVSTGCYFNQAANITGDYPGLDDETTVLEMVLWQVLMGVGVRLNDPIVFNFTIDHNLTELYGAYNYRHFNLSNSLSAPMTAVGVRCTSSASVGSADIDGASSTYTNFVRSDTPIGLEARRCALRFGAPAIFGMFARFVSPTTSGSGTGSWIHKFFTSVGLPPNIYTSYGSGSTGPPNVTLVENAYFQANDLKNSMLRAHAAYAVQLMFNSGQGFKTSSGIQPTSANPNVTEFVPGQVLKPGAIPAYVPAALFVAWAIVVPILCAAYSFRRRWSDTLDGYSLFRFGADLSEDEKARVSAFTNTGEMEECPALRGLPGFVGDKRPGGRTGRIALVDGALAEKSKPYD